MNVDDLTLDDFGRLVTEWARANGYAAHEATIHVSGVTGEWTARAHCGPMNAGCNASATGANLIDACRGVARLVSVDVTERAPARVLDLSIAMAARRKREAER